MSSSSRHSGIDPQKQLEVIKSLIATDAYHYSKKVRQLIDDGWYETDDLERCILSATSIHKVEEDDMGGEHSVILTLLMADADNAQTPDPMCRSIWHSAAPTSGCCSPHTTRHPSV